MVLVCFSYFWVLSHSGIWCGIIMAEPRILARNTNPTVLRSFGQCRFVPIEYSSEIPRVIPRRHTPSRMRNRKVYYSNLKMTAVELMLEVGSLKCNWRVICLTFPHWNLTAIRLFSACASPSQWQLHQSQHHWRHYLLVPFPPKTLHLPSSNPSSNLLLHVHLSPAQQAAATPANSPQVVNRKKVQADPSYGLYLLSKQWIDDRLLAQRDYSAPISFKLHCRKGIPSLR
jgi:hypothetical protein